jgi:hypothetical protein
MMTTSERFMFGTLPDGSGTIQQERPTSDFRCRCTRQLAQSRHTPLTSGRNYKARVAAPALQSEPDMRISATLVTLALLGVVSACDRTADQDPAADGGTDANPQACPTPLDDETLAALSISIEPDLAMQPGQSRDLGLGNVECCYVFEPVEACATWSVAPDDHAAIDPDTGRLEILGSASPGEVVTVTADVEDGRRLVEIDVHIYTPEANPLYGVWREDLQYACADGAEVTPEHRINELRFRADGTIHVTWFPFELYVDYWGSYSYDLDDGSLELTVTGGNYVPDDLDGAGRFSIDEDGRLVLDEMWLGSPDQAEAAAGCGHRFSR